MRSELRLHIDGLADWVGMSRRTFTRTFRLETGMGFVALFLRSFGMSPGRYAAAMMAGAVEAF